MVSVAPWRIYIVVRIHKKVKLPNQSRPLSTRLKFHWYRRNKQTDYESQTPFYPVLSSLGCITLNNNIVAVHIQVRRAARTLERHKLGQ